MNSTNQIQDVPLSRHTTNAAAITASQGATATAGKGRRIPALDFTKGALVLIMVLYHWLNYFSGTHDNRYLRFLTPSFIFITGFLISHIYLSKYGAADRMLPMRLVQRGLKILAVFVALNLVRGFTVAGNGLTWSGLQLSARSFLEIFVLGSIVGGGEAKAVSFFILVPISYLLILSAGLVFVARSFRYIFHITGLLFLLSIPLLHVYGIQSGNLELVTIGLMGVAVGYFPMSKVDAYVRHPSWLAIGYLGYLGAITIWNVIYPLQVVGVLLSLAIIYLVGEASGESGPVSSRVVLLGKYSLFGYIAQIAILQLLRTGLKHVDSQVTVIAISFFLAFALTVASVEFVDILRKRSRTIDTLYKFVFA